METRRVKVRFVLEGEYEVNFPSDAYPDCHTVEEAVEVDRDMFIHLGLADDVMAAAMAGPVAMEILEVTDG